MVEELILEGRNATLIIEMDSDSLAKCFFIKPEGKIFLGTQTKNYIVNQLVGCFEKFDPNSTQMIDGYPVTWVLTLSENHSVLYCGKDKNIFLLFWQDSREKSFGIIEVMEVEEIEARDWLRKLKVFASFN